jgi:HlyD family secretion protein
MIMTETREPLAFEAATPAAASSTPRRNVALPQRKSVRWRRRLRALALLSIALAAVGGLVLVWVPEPVPVDLETVSAGPMQVTVDEDGRARVKDRYVVSAPLLASVARIELHPGDRVQPGLLLARLTPLEPPLLDSRSRALQSARVAAALAGREQAASAVVRAQAALEYAQGEAVRERALNQSGASAERLRERAELEARTLAQELASTHFAARTADYEVQMARLALDRQRGGSADKISIVSPVEGQVLRVLQESAGVVQPGSPLLELGDLKALEIVVDVLTSEAVSIRPGAPAIIDHWGGARPIAAHVRAVEPSAFTRISALGVEEQRVNVVLDLDTPREQWATLGDGFRVETRIEVWSGKDVLSAPASAVFRQRGQWVAFEEQGGRAKLATLELGQRNGERVEIARGLRKGARVVVHPSERLVAGARVEAREEHE